MQYRKIITTSLVVIWLGVIFLFSSQNGTTSKSLSDKVVSGVVDGVGNITNNQLPKEEKDKLVKTSRVIVRKGAHFTAFFILGVLVYFAVSSYSTKNTFLLSIGICILFACGDEIHQLFSNGRTARVFDVFIDTLGSSCAIIITQYYTTRKKITKYKK